MYELYTEEIEGWWDKFTGYCDGVMDKSDGYLDATTTLEVLLTPDTADSSLRRGETAARKEIEAQMRNYFPESLCERVSGCIATGLTESVREVKVSVVVWGSSTPDGDGARMRARNIKKGL